MIERRLTLGAPSRAWTIVPARSARGLVRDRSRRFHLRVPPRWRSPHRPNPFAAEAGARVLAWLEALGCTPAEVQRARGFDAAGYVGLPFPSLGREATIRVAKYLVLWLLWDDVGVETLDDRWRIDAGDVLAGRRPEGMTRFDEGWWQILTELAGRRSPGWLESLCRSMAAWSDAAAQEAVMIRAYRERGVVPRFAPQLEMRSATIGMYTTTYLLEDAHDVELPPEFHAHPGVARLKRLTSEIVGLGNDIFSFGKDCVEGHPNLASTLMRGRGLSAAAALTHLVRMHEEALAAYDRLADSLIDATAAPPPLVARWLQDLRRASIGFSLWESQAPRYTAHKLVVGGRVIEPRFSFLSSPKHPKVRPPELGQRWESPSTAGRRRHAQEES